MQIQQVLVIFYWNQGTLALFHGQFTRLFVWYVNRQADKAGPKKVDEVIRSRGFFSFFLQAVARLQIGPAAKAAHYSQICSMHLRLRASKEMAWAASWEQTRNLVISVLRSVNFEEAR